ncbi:hypothetical protein FB45DRAFT_869203 [Roridomyces roridus]|uniref:Uncharacterized protein n=1 Tax=Roridomyces roridus TaxID=1738132 RepID=A0AAD7FL54_9AGAR|nr:hypothetical protein FB45DRAFT_869203 [Roridomyces roridus]
MAASMSLVVSLLVVHNASHSHNAIKAYLGRAAKIEEAQTALWDPESLPEKWTPSILPLPLTSSKARPPTKEPKRMGCQWVDSTWAGKGEGLGSVAVQLPDVYFTEEQRLLLGGGPRSEACGCLSVGIGCCVCGNTLGVHKTLCATHRHMLPASSYTFLADSVSPPSPLRRKSPTPDQEQSRYQPYSVPWPRTPATLDDWLSQARLTPSEEELGSLSSRVGQNIPQYEFNALAAAASNEAT